MAFFFDQRQRLLRENWTANELSQEIFAMMSPDSPMTTQAPVTVSQQPNGVAPFQVQSSPDGTTPLFSVNGGSTVLSFAGNQFTVTQGGTTKVIAGGGGGSGGSVIPVWG